MKGEGATTPAYSLGRFPIGDRELACAVPGCLRVATCRVAWLYRAEVFDFEFCDQCGAQADGREIRQIAPSPYFSTSLAYVAGDGCVHRRGAPPA